jgi:hypothetical protein
LSKVVSTPPRDSRAARGRRRAHWLSAARRRRSRGRGRTRPSRYVRCRHRCRHRTCAVGANRADSGPFVVELASERATRGVPQRNELFPGRGGRATNQQLVGGCARGRLPTQRPRLTA